MKARIKNAPRAALNSVLAVVLVVGLAPSVSFAGQDTVTVRDSEGELAGKVVEQQVSASEQAVPTIKEQAEPLTGSAVSDSFMDAGAHPVANLQKEMAKVSLTATVPTESAANMGAADVGSNDAKIDVTFAGVVEQSVDADNYYFNDSVDVTVKITDADFQSGTVVAKKGEDEKAKETGFTGTGDEKTATLTLNKDNIGTDAVTIVVIATDANGDSREYVCGETLTDCSAKVGTDDYESGKGVKLNYAPVVTISWSVNPKGSSTLSSDRVVFDSTVETSLVATITVTDATLPVDYSDSDNLGKCMITQTGASDKQATMSGANDAWTKKSDTEYTKDIKFACADNMVGGLQVSATDAGGVPGESVADTRSMVADDAAPTVKVEWAGGGEPVSDDGATYYGTARVATVTVEDTVGFAKADADEAMEAVGYSSTTSTATPTEGDAVTKMVYTYTFGENVVDGDCSLSVGKIVDFSGRSATVAKDESDTGTVTDATYSSDNFKMLVKPILETAIEGDRKAVLQNGEDNADKSAVYGSLSVTYTVKDLAWATDKGSVTYGGTNAPMLSWLPDDSDAAVTHQAVVALGADDAATSYEDLVIGGVTFQKRVDGESETYVDMTSEELKLTVPNGESTTTTSIVVDKKAPTLTVTWDTNEPAQTVNDIPYYNIARVATIVVEDETGLDEATLAALTDDANYTGGVPAVVSADSTETEKSEQINGLYTKYVVKVTYSENTATNSTCALVIPKGVKDAAGNELTCSDSAHFEDGKYTANGFKMLVTPTVSINSTDAVKDNTIGLKSLYVDSRTVTYTVTTASWDDDNKPKVTIDAPGETGKELDISWSPSSKQEGTVTYVGTVSITKSGIYENLKYDWGGTSFLVEGAEEAAATSYTEDTGFVVDADAPEISVDWNPANSTETYRGDSLYGVERVATIVIEDETGLDDTTLSALAATEFKGGVFALVDTDSTAKPKSEKSTDGLYTKYVAKVTYGANHYANACTFELPTVDDVAGHNMTSEDADYVDSTHTYKSVDFRMLVNPVLTVKDITPNVTKFNVDDVDYSYYKAPFTVTWSLWAASGDQAKELDIVAPGATVDEAWVKDSTVTNENEGAGIAYTRAVVFSNSADLTNAITVSSSTLQFVKPASSSQGSPSNPEELDASYVFVPADFTVDATQPKLNLSLTPAEGIMRIGDEHPESGATVYFGGARTSDTDTIATAVMAINEANPLNTGNIKANFGGSVGEYDFSSDALTVTRTYTADGTYTILVNGNGENNAARDLVGNLLTSGDVSVPSSAIYTMTVVIDTQAPVITAQYVDDKGNPIDVYSAVGEKTNAEIEDTGATYYYGGEAAKLRVFVDDANFDPDNTKINDEAPADGWEPVSADEGNTKYYADIDVATAESPAQGEDKKTEVSVTSTDKANNSASKFEIKSVADKKDPVVEVAYYTNYGTGNQAFVEKTGDTYYANDTVTAEITVTESYFHSAKKPDDIPGNTYTEVASDNDPSGWVEKDGKYVNTVEFAGVANQETAFTLGLTARDMAANSTEYPTDKILVDMKAPVITSVDFYKGKGESLTKFDPYAEGDAYYSNEDVTVKVVIDEANLDKEVTANLITVNGVAASGLAWDGNTAIFELDVTDDPANYYIVAQAVDFAKPDSNKSNVEERTLRLDKMTPKLTVELPDYVTVENETTATEIRHYDGTVEDDKVVATVTVADKYLNPSDVEFLKDNVKIVAPGADITLDSTNAEKPQWKVVFNAPKDDEDVEYSLSITGHDKAGNELESGDGKTFVSKTHEYKTTVVIDKKVPVLSVEWDNNDVRNGFYYKAARTATITIDEKYFDPAVVKVDGKTTAVDDWDTPEGSTKHTYKVKKDYGESQNNRLIIEGADRSKNKLTGEDNAETEKNHRVVDVGGKYDSGRFVVDLTAPVVTFTMRQARTNVFGGVDYYRLGNKLNVGVSVVEKNFAPKTDRANNTVITPSGTNTADYDLSGWDDATKSYELTFAPNDAYGAEAYNTLTATVYDLAGNSATFTYGDASGASGRAVDSIGTPLSGNSRFALDVHAPSITQGNGANIPNRETDNNYADTLIFYKNPTTLGIVVTDALGIERITGAGSDYTFTAVDGFAGDKEWAMEVALRNGVEFTDAFELTATDVAHNVHKWKINPATLDVDDISTDAENTPIYGNLPNLYPKALVLDTTFPELSLTDLGNNTYYNYPQTVTLNITELNFRYLVDYNGTQTVLTTDAEPGGSGTPQSPTAQVSNMSPIDELAGRYTYSATYSADGHYVVHAEVTDPAGNRTAIQTNRFTIDRTAPEIDVSFDNNSATNGNYYAAGRTATIVVTEHNFDAALINIATNGSVGSWSHDGDRHVITVGFGSDGTYNLSVSGRDLAGNTFPTYTADQFIVDMTAPSITISFLGGDSESQRAFNNVVQPVITFSDEANYDANGANFTIRGNKTGEVTYSFDRASDGNGETVTYADFEHVIGVDDIYTITASLTDMAGNQATEATETFSVNRFGSNYIIVSPAASGADSSDLGYLDEAPEIVVREINVAGVEESSVAVTYNLKTTNLERQTASGRAGYTVQDLSSAADYGWQQYEYTIARESFIGETGGESPDGNYVVVLSSHDATGNTNSSANFWVDKSDTRVSAEGDAEATETEKRMSAAVKFTLDTTPPDILGLSVSNHETVNSAGETEVSFTATDNIGFDEDSGVVILVDGKPVAHDVASDGSGKVSFLVPEKPFAEQQIEITVADFATNERTLGKTDNPDDLTGGFSIKVTSNFFDLYLPFIVAGIAVVIGAAIAAFVVARRRAGKN